MVSSVYASRGTSKDFLVRNVVKHKYLRPLNFILLIQKYGCNSLRAYSTLGGVSSPSRPYINEF